MLFQPQTNCAARCAGNRGIIEPYELGTYDGLDVKVWDWGPDVTRCGPEVVLIDSAPPCMLPMETPSRCLIKPHHQTVACRYPSSSRLL